MSDDLYKIALGTCYGDHSELKDALSEFTDQEVGNVQIPGLAGPNDLAQILASVDQWKLIGITIFSIFGTGFISEAGKDAWRALAPKLIQAPSLLREKFLRLVRALQKEQQNGQDVSIGLIEPTFDYQARYDRIYLSDLSPEEVARKVYIFSQCVKPVSSWLSQIYNSQENKGDVMVKMEITDDGNLIVELVPGIGKFPSFDVTRKVFDISGKIIEET